MSSAGNRIGAEHASGPTGIAFRGATYPLAFFMADVRMTGSLSHDENYVWLHQDGGLAALPLPAPDTWRLFVEVTRQEAQQHAITLEDIRRFMVERAPDASVSAKATVLDWPAKEGEPPPVLRSGTNGWTCVPDMPDSDGSDPMCLDHPWMKWVEGYLAHKAPHTTSVGIGYMIAPGGGRRSNTDPYAMAATADNQWSLHLPHLMILVPDLKSLEGISTSNGQVDGDGFDRQREAITRFARRAGFRVVEEFRDEGISGTRELEDRPGLAAVLDRIEHNGVRVVLIERSDRLARALVVGEVILAQFRNAGAIVLTVEGVDLTVADEDAERTLIRQVLCLHRTVRKSSAGAKAPGCPGSDSQTSRALRGSETLRN